MIKNCSVFGKKTASLTPKSYDEHSVLFICEPPPPPPSAPAGFYSVITFPITRIEPKSLKLILLIARDFNTCK